MVSPLSRRFCQNIPEPSYDSLGTNCTIYKSNSPLPLQSGVNLKSFDVAYETWGTLNRDRSNAILLFTGLSASSHAASSKKDPTPGWWEDFIGVNKALDTNKFFIICCNSIGGCFGSSGPLSVDPVTLERYGLRFPQVTIDDIVASQMDVLDHLGITKAYAVVGASMGGMMSLCAAAKFPDRFDKCISISSCGRSYPFSIAIRYCQRQVLMADPEWKEGEYYEKSFPFQGMKRARELGTISYRSGPEWEERFGRQRKNSTENRFGPDFLVEHYLEHQGERWANASSRFDPNAYLILSKAMDLFDLSVEGDYEKGICRIKSKTLVMGSVSDLLLPVWQQREIATILRKSGTRCIYYEIDSKYGHDTFLVDVDTISAGVKGHLETS